MNAITKKHPHLRKPLLKLAIAIAAVSLSACSTDDSGDDASADTGAGAGAGAGTGGAGGAPASGLISFTVGNYEDVIKFVGPRFQNSVSEPYRLLELIHFGVDENTGALIAGDDIVQKMVEADPDREALGTWDPFTVHDCTMTERIVTEYVDTDASGTLTANDQILRNYGNAGCPLDASGNALQPTSITGSVNYVFAAGSDPATGRYVGTATYNDYQQNGGLLDIAASISETFNGTVDFDLNILTGNAIFTNLQVTIDGENSSLATPNLMAATSITRTIDSEMEDSVVIVGGSVTSQTSGLQTTFATTDFNGAGFVAPTGGSPITGALLFQGENSAARVVTRPSGGSTPAQLDSDGDGDFSEGVSIEPTSLSFVIGGFLIPGA